MSHKNLGCLADHLKSRPFGKFSTRCLQSTTKKWSDPCFSASDMKPQLDPAQTIPTPPCPSRALLPTCHLLLGRKLTFACRQIIREISRDPAGILITSYEQLRIQRDLLMGVRWGYAILDEGHKIRNPDADVTLVAKQLQTVRIFLNINHTAVSATPLRVDVNSLILTQLFYGT